MNARQKKKIMNKADKDILRVIQTYFSIPDNLKVKVDVDPIMMYNHAARLEGLDLGYNKPMDYKETLVFLHKLGYTLEEFTKKNKYKNKMDKYLKEAQHLGNDVESFNKQKARIRQLINRAYYHNMYRRV